MYRIKIMTTCHVLYLSDPPIRTQICREVSPTMNTYKSFLYMNIDINIEQRFVGVDKFCKRRWCVNM